MSTEVASTRLSSDLLRQIDREAAARGLSRSLYLAHLIERGAAREASPSEPGDGGTLRVLLTAEQRERRDSDRTVHQLLRELLSTLQNRVPVPAPVTDAETRADTRTPLIVSPLLERLVFSTLFTEALLKRVSAALYRNPGELAQVVREAREQATAEACTWQERITGRTDNSRINATAHRGKDPS